MKRLFAFVFALLLVVSCSGTIEEPEKTPEKSSIPVSSISLSKQSAELVEGESITLIATLSPSNATDNKVSWSSSKSSVASVDQKGTVSAVSVGSATITASAGGKSSSCNVTVIAKTIEVSSIDLDKTNLSIQVGEEYQLKASVNPSNATNKTVEWSSALSSIATVNNNGLVKGIAVGETDVTASCGGKKVVCRVVVSSNELVISVSKGGTLQNELSKHDLTGITKIVITGILNDEDFLTLKNYSIETLDLSGVNIAEIPLKGRSFLNCHNLIFPNSLQNIKDDQFSSCYGLRSISFGASLISIGASAFSYCENLEAVDFNSPLLETIGEYAFYRCEHLLSISIPPKVKAIQPWTFSCCYRLEIVSFSESGALEEIGGEYYFSSSQGFGDLNSDGYLGGAFSDCGNLKRIAIPSSVRIIGDIAFAGCHRLKSVTFGNNSSLTSIGKMAFYKCDFSEIIIPKSVKTLGKSAFCSNNSLDTIMFEEGSQLKSIPYGAFSYLGKTIQSLVLPASITSVSYGAFARTAINTLSFEKNSELTKLGDGGYHGRDPYGIFNSYNSDGNTTDDCGERFEYWGLYGSLKILDATNCQKLNKIVQYAFWQAHLDIVKIGSTTPPTLGTSEGYTISGTILKVPKEALDAYKSNEAWAKNFESVSAIDD